MSTCANACLRDAMPNGVFCHPCASWIAWCSTGRTEPSPAQTESESKSETSKKGSKKR